MGGRQWHGGVRPIFRGGMTALRHENLHGGTKAACSVACLERLWWITEQRTVTKGSRKPPRSLCETTTAKEARKEPRLPRKAPRLRTGYNRDYSVVSVVIRSRARKRRGARFQGKPLLWRQEVTRGESLPNLSRKVYLLYHHLSFASRLTVFRGLFLP